MSYHNIPSSAIQSKTNAQGQVAPQGYHYMPDGTLMSDAEHARLYDKKIIKDFNIDLSNMAAASTTRAFQVIGDNGAIFSLEVTNEDGYYYNFTTNTFAAAHKRLKNRRVDNGVYNGSITFPTITDDDHYNIYVFAESMHGTVHTEYSEVRFGDDSIDINSSTGSNSNLLMKIIYQYTDVTIH